jgi:hypothetical protein
MAYDPNYPEFDDVVKSRPGRKRGKSSMGPTVQVTYRLPKKIHEKLMKISQSTFQPLPVVLRAAAAEFVRKHRPVRWGNNGIELKFPEDVKDIRAASDQEEIELLTNNSTEVDETESGTPVSVDKKEDRDKT